MTTKEHEMRLALELVLLFYSDVNWTPESRVLWEKITGSPVATTGSLCAHIRKVLKA
jgi:hypothetical protein